MLNSLSNVRLNGMYVLLIVGPDVEEGTKYFEFGSR